MYSRAAELGDKDALYLMGVLHEEGAHVPKSKYIAGDYYKKASKMGQTDAKVNLAVMLMDDFADDENMNNDTVIKEMGETGDLNSPDMSIQIHHKKLIPQSRMHHLRFEKTYFIIYF